jgi:CheY-like chemotaxis protein
MTDSIVVLVVEDEPAILIVMEDALREGGFTVVTAANGMDAIATLERRHDELRAVVTDIRLGDGPDGWQLAHRARELNGQIAVVYVTGDSVDDWPANGVPKSVVIQKPFAEAQLLTAISTLLTDVG